MREETFEPERGGGVMVWALRQLAFWLIGGLAIYLIVTNWGPLTIHQDDGVNPTATAAVVDTASSPLANSLILHAGHDGHVLVDAAVNGTLLHMAFDTGATFVALTQADAARIRHCRWPRLHDPIDYR